ncbi:MAG: hypothetical protein P8Y03_31200 [Anaerolineales bacterium]
MNKARSGVSPGALTCVGGTFESARQRAGSGATGLGSLGSAARSLYTRVKCVRRGNWRGYVRAGYSVVKVLAIEPLIR